MSTIPTQNPVPSEAAKDLKFNSGKIDEFVTSMKDKYVDRFGKEHFTIEGLRWVAQQAISQFGYITLDSFQKGAEITLPNQVLRDEVTGEYYRWDGDLPKSVPVNSTPDNSGGVGVSKWLGVGDATLRSELASNKGASLIGTSGGLTVQNALDKKANNHNETLDNIMSKMASGDVVKICCYGDSTTDGMGTSNWTGNPTANNNAIGETNHNDNAQNAWPYQLQLLLRKYYQNNNIYVYNAGYSGKKLIDGWALRNFDAAVTNNPYYGLCDVVFIDFGLNDITEKSGLVDRTINETIKLVKKIESTGALPVLLGSGPMFRSGIEGDKDKLDVIQKINTSKRHVSKVLNIPYIDKSNDILTLLNNNTNLKWRDLQPDGLHFGDVGHKIQALCIFNLLYSSITRIYGRHEYISFMDSRSNSFIGSSNTFNQSNTLFGCNALLSASNYNNNLNREAIDICLYVESITDIIYFARSSDGCRYGEQLPKIKITNLMTSEIIFNDSPSNTNTNQLNSWLDQPLHLATVQPGFYSVKYILGDKESSQSKYFGHFLFANDWIPKVLEYEYRYIGNIKYPTIASLDAIFKAESSLYYAGASSNNRYFNISFKADIPLGSAIILMGGSKGEGGRETYLALYRGGSSMNLILVSSLNEVISYSVIRSINITTNEIIDISLSAMRKNEINYMEISVGDKMLKFDSSNNSVFDFPMGGYVSGAISFKDLTTKNEEVSIYDLNIITKDY
ncbi:GDSL-type esterase/lipase family protein [Proteus terrae]|uniref:GDSL-type esterase/lipase family protein n=1 Tax=Proteus terrae TaxID=1574161 RepID=UPI001C5F4D9B|nr:GDSL-type esterase/lipase family protein [Proteus terrae]